MLTFVAGYYSVAMLSESLLSKMEQASLSNHLSQCLCNRECDNTLRRTKRWLLKCIPVERRGEILEEFGRRGGHCDCEVLANVFGIVIDEET